MSGVIASTILSAIAAMVVLWNDRGETVGKTILYFSTIVILAFGVTVVVNAASEFIS